MIIICDTLLLQALTSQVTNQPYDESLDVGDAEEVASQYTPTPRVPHQKAGS